MPQVVSYLVSAELCSAVSCIFVSQRLRFELLDVPNGIIDPALAGGVVVGRQTHPGLVVGQGQAVDTVGVDVVLEGPPRVGQGRGVEEGVLDGPAPSLKVCQMKAGAVVLSTCSSAEKWYAPSVSSLG